jgi:small GTP-binding protein
LTALTDVYSEAASYEFTTLTCVPGVKFWRGAKIQLLDLPGIIEGAKDGKGRGRQVIAVARTCSCLIIVLDAMKPLQHKVIIDKELEGVGIRLNQTPPAITVKKKDRGGLNLSTSCKLTHMDEDSIAAILKEYKIVSADVRINCDATADELIDVIEGNRIYMPCVYALNKVSPRPARACSPTRPFARSPCFRTPLSPYPTLCCCSRSCSRCSRCLPIDRCDHDGGARRARCCPPLLPDLVALQLEPGRADGQGLRVP